MKKLFSLFAIALFAMSAMADNYLPGDWNSWGTGDDVKFVNNEVTLTLNAATVYEFKIKDTGMSGNDNNWFGNGGTMNFFNHTGWGFYSDNNEAPNCKITTKEAGNYTFRITWNGASPSISVTYPNCIWNGCSFLGDGAQGGALNYKYMVSAPAGVNNIANIQHPGFATEDGIYMGFVDAAFNKLVDEEGNEITYDQQGAGICLHISNFYKQVTTVTVKNGDTERWTFYVYYADGVNFVNTPSEYCDYEGTETEKDGNYVTLTWSTNHSGNVVISMANGTGATSCSFRNGGFEGGIDAFIVSTDDFATSEPASNYFTFEKVYSGNIATLVRIAPLPEGAKIKHVGQPGNVHAFAWKVNGTDAWCWPDFIYTYGANCPVLEDTEAPTAFSAVVKEVSYTSVTLTLQATDNVASKIYYTITDNNSNVYETNAPSGNEVDYVIKGLALNTAYTFSVVASDARENGNETAAISNLQATTLVGATPATYYGVQSGVATTAYIQGVQTANVPYNICYAITRNADFTLSCTAFVAGEYAQANGLANGSVGYRGSADWADFTRNPDGTRTRQTSKDTYEAFEGRGITCMFHFPAQEALINPYFEGYVVGAEANTYVLNDRVVNGWYTICLPFNATIDGATLYSITNATNEAITINNEGTDLVAGKAYLYKATAATVTATYTAVAAHTADNYLVGNLSATPVNLTVTDDAYILGDDNMFHHIEGTATATVGQYKAYLKLPVPSAAPTLRIVEEGYTATAMDALENSATEVVKFIENGQVLILKNGVVYNVMGQVIK